MTEHPTNVVWRGGGDRERERAGVSLIETPEASTRNQNGSISCPTLVVQFVHTLPFYSLDKPTRPKLSLDREQRSRFSRLTRRNSTNSFHAWRVTSKWRNVVFDWYFGGLKKGRMDKFTIDRLWSEFELLFRDLRIGSSGNLALVSLDWKSDNGFAKCI